MESPVATAIRASRGAGMPWLSRNSYFIIYSSFQYDTTFNPIKEAMSVNRKKSRMGVAGSLKMNIPIKTVPTAPIPVQMAYAVPKGKV